MLYEVVLGAHIVAAMIMVTGTLFTLGGACLRRGSLGLSKWVLVVSGACTVLSGVALVAVTGQSLGRVCVLGTSLVVAAWVSYLALRIRVQLPVSA